MEFSAASSFGSIVLTSTFKYNFLVLIYVSEIFKKTII